MMLVTRSSRGDQPQTVHQTAAINPRPCTNRRDQPQPPSEAKAQGVWVAKPPPRGKRSAAAKTTQATRLALSASMGRLSTAWAILGSNQ